MPVERVSSGTSRNKTRAEIVGLALPNIVANLSTPLISLVDSFVAGHLDDVFALPAMAVGVSCLLMIYNLFIFLRKGTTGLSSQARGAHNVVEVRSTAIRSILTAIVIGAALIASRHAIVDGIILRYWIQVDHAGVRDAARGYVFARMWGAPFALGNYAVTGFLNGMAKSKAVLRQQLMLNSLNAFLCVSLAMPYPGLDLGIGGIGYAAALANCIAFLFGVCAVARAVSDFDEQETSRPIANIVGYASVNRERLLDRGTISGDRNAPSIWRQVLHPERLKEMLFLSGTITVRSLCVTLAITSFTALTASLNDRTLLAANLLLLQMHDLISTGTDGFSNAAEALVGEAIGAKDAGQLTLVVAETLKIGGLLACMYSACYFVLGRFFFAAMTSDQQIVETAHSYLCWLTVGPFLAVWAFLFDGFFVGATLSKEMMYAMAAATFSYVVTLLFVAGDVVGKLPFLAAAQDNAARSMVSAPMSSTSMLWMYMFPRQNDKLWFCFYAFMVYRSFFLWLMSDKLGKKARRGEDSPR